MSHGTNSSLTQLPPPPPAAPPAGKPEKKHLFVTLTTQCSKYITKGQMVYKGLRFK